MGDLQDGDEICIREKPKSTRENPPRKVKFHLRTPDWMTWWKALSLHKENQFYYEIVWNSDNTHYNANSCEYAELMENYLILSKAKAFGAHINMYWIQNSYAL